MLTAYIQAAMRHATYEIRADNEGYYGELPGLQGVWGNADTLEGCREALQASLEDWIVFRLRRGLDVPVLDDISQYAADRPGGRLMPPWDPVSRAKLIRGLRALGFEGPFPGPRHNMPPSPAQGEGAGG